MTIEILRKRPPITHFRRVIYTIKHNYRYHNVRIQSQMTKKKVIE